MLVEARAHREQMVRGTRSGPAGAGPALRAIRAPPVAMHRGEKAGINRREAASAARACWVAWFESAAC